MNPNSNLIENEENISKMSNKNKSKITPKYNYNSNNSMIIRKSLNLNKKLPNKNEWKEKNFKLPPKKENLRKSLAPYVEKQTSKLQSIEINLNCDQDSLKKNQNNIENEKIIRENLQKDKSKDVCLALEDLKLPTGYHIDSQGNQKIELLDLNDHKNDDNISIQDINQLIS